MSELGISVFCGLNQTVEQNINYLQLARQCGYSKLFTSLHIPESDSESLVLDARRILLCAAELGFRVTADISPQTWSQFAIDPGQLKKIGVSTARIDYGISAAQMLDLARTAAVAIEINASTLSEPMLLQLLAAGLQANQLTACHNYYPRPETGLSYALFAERSRLFSVRGIPVTAFIPGLQNPRGPIFAGLPTVEAHRNMCSVDAARQLWASGSVENILWGDPLVAETDLRAVSRLAKPTGEPLALRLIAENIGAAEAELVWLPVHTNRLDAAAMVIRSQESRNHCRQTIVSQGMRKRQRGDVTLDNQHYGRYMGELQIVLQELPADERVNVIGRVVAADLCLLDCISAGGSFCFRGESHEFGSIIDGEAQP